MDAPHQDKLTEALEALERRDIDRFICTMPPRHGKALALDTPVPTPFGWKAMGRLRVGDKVFDETGHVCRVTWVSPVWRERPVYSVTTDDGDVVVADAEHEWPARLDGKRPVFKMHTTAVLARSRQKRAMIKRAAPLDLPERNDLAIEPYVLGAWLGDGNSQHATMTSGDQDRAWMRSEFERLGYKTSDRANVATFGVVGGLQGQLRTSGLLHNKRIPAGYLRASAAQRLALLQGLVDTDGHVNPNDGQVEIITIHERLAHQIRELVWSLGRKAGLCVGRASIQGRDCGPKFRVLFYHAEAARMPRKRAHCRDVAKTPHRYVSAEPCGVADTVCIEVDSPSHLFLCGRSMLPTHNSQKVSVQFPAWYLGRHPSHQLISASYAAPLAQTFSREVRNLIADPEMFPAAMAAGCQVAPDSKSVALWKTTRNGGMRAVGVGGGATGHGAHLLNIDDYLKDDADASSEVIREKQWRWWQSTSRTRLMPDAIITITATRWHEDDLIGRILNQPGALNRWHVLELPAVAGWPDAIGKRLPSWPAQGDVLGRPDGAALWPAWYPTRVLDEIKGDVGSRVWASLFQCRPTAAEGNVIRRSWMSKRYRELPPMIAVWLSVDASYKEGVGSDYSVVAVWGTDGVNYYLIDCWRARVEFPELKRAMADMWAKWSTLLGAVVHGMLVEDAANGTPAIQEFKRETAVPLVAVKAVISKVARIESVAPLFEAGKVYLPDPNGTNVLPEGAPWIGDWVEEHAGMPNAAHDDMVDTTSQALARLSGRGTPGWLTYVHQRAAEALAEASALNNIARMELAGDGALADLTRLAIAAQPPRVQPIGRVESGFLAIARRSQPGGAV